MTTVKERYYELKKQTDKYFEGFRDPIHDYVAELEQELTKLKESQTQLCNRVDKAEAENVGLKKAISFYYTYHKDSRNDGVIFEEFNKICPMK